jgi:hypothetical protein
MEERTRAWSKGTRVRFARVARRRLRWIQLHVTQPAISFDPRSARCVRRTHSLLVITARTSILEAAAVHSLRAMLPSTTRVAARCCIRRSVTIQVTRRSLSCADRTNTTRAQPHQTSVTRASPFSSSSVRRGAATLASPMKTAPGGGTIAPGTQTVEIDRPLELVRSCGHHIEKHAMDR